MYWTGKLMNNLLSYCGLVDVRINAPDKDLPVTICGIKHFLKVNFEFMKEICNMSISLKIACTSEANSAYHNYWHRLSWQACTLSLDVRKNACKLARAWQHRCSVVAVRTLGVRILCRKIPNLNIKWCLGTGSGVETFFAKTLAS